MLIDADDVDSQGRRALASVKSAWVGLVPNTDNPSVKKAGDWRQDLEKIGYTINSIYTYKPVDDINNPATDSPLEVFEKVNNPNPNLIGILDGVGLPLPRSAFHAPKSVWIRL